MPGQVHRRSHITVLKQASLSLVETELLGSRVRKPLEFDSSTNSACSARETVRDSPRPRGLEDK